MRVATFTYNSANKYVLSTAIVDPGNSLTTSCAPSNNGGALNLTTVFGFDAAGNVATVQDPRSNITSYNFDRQRRLTRVTPPTSIGAATRYCYDGDGLLRSTNRARVAGAADPNAATVATTGQCSTAFNASQWQSIRQNFYATGELQSVIDANGFTTTYGYDAEGRQNFVMDPDGRQSATVYDLAGQAVCAWRGGKSPATNWSAGRPSANLPTDTTCAWNPASYVDGSPLRYAGYGYSANGKQSSVRDAKNNLTQSAFDAFDRLQSTTYADNTHEDLQYTVDGTATGALCNSASRQPCRKINRAGQVTAFTYDNLDRLSTKQPADQGTTTYGYDLLGAPTLVSRAVQEKLQEKLRCRT